MVHRKLQLKSQRTTGRKLVKTTGSRPLNAPAMNLEKYATDKQEKEQLSYIKKTKKR